jgi:hypothetical protein
MAQIKCDIRPLTKQVQLWWTRQHLHQDENGLASLYRNPCGSGCGWQRNRTPEQIAASLRPYIKVDAVQLAGILQQPDTKTALAVASALAPSPVGLELNFVVDAIKLAGAQTVRQRNRAFAGLALTGALLLFWLAFKD